MENLENFSSQLSKHFTESDFKEINAVIKTVRLKKGDILLQEGDVSQIIYLILDGKVDVTKKISENNILHLTTVGTGNILGEISILTGSGKTATCIAQTDVKAYELDLGMIQKKYKPLRQSVTQSCCRTFSKIFLPAAFGSKTGRGSQFHFDFIWLAMEGHH